MNTPHTEKYLLITGSKIASARRNRAEKMDTVAKATGTSIKVISQVENGRYRCLKLQTLARLCEYLQIPMDDILVDPQPKVN